MEDKCPVSEGDEETVIIEAIGKKGDGIAKIDRYTIFVPNTNVGEEVKVKITKVLPKYAFAEKIDNIFPLPKGRGIYP